VSQSIPFALPAAVARADGDVLVSSEGLVSSEELRRGGGGIKARPHHCHQRSETTHNTLSQGSAPCSPMAAPSG
jgi:hypothetical protein